MLLYICPCNANKEFNKKGLDQHQRSCKAYKKIEDLEQKVDMLTELSKAQIANTNNSSMDKILNISLSQKEQEIERLKKENEALKRRNKELTFTLKRVRTSHGNTFIGPVMQVNVVFGKESLSHIDRAAVCALLKSNSRQNWKESVPLFIEMVYKEPRNATIQCRNIGGEYYLVLRGKESFHLETMKSIHEKLFTINCERMMTMLEQYLREQEFLRGSPPLDAFQMQERTLELDRISNGIGCKKSKGNRDEDEGDFKGGKEVLDHIKRVIREYLGR